MSAEEIRELYQGLVDSDLTNFDMMLSGYTGSKDAVEAVGEIGRDLRYRSRGKPGSFFWSELVFRFNPTRHLRLDSTGSGYG